MGNFRSDKRERFGDRDRSSRGRSGRGGFGGRGGERRGSRGGFGDKRRPQMHDVTCDKCGKECQVPFRPTGDKPVLCSDCFRKNNTGNDFSSNTRLDSQSMSSEQFDRINKKLDKILNVLEMLEIEDSDEEIDEDEEQEEEDDSEEETENN